MSARPHTTQTHRKRGTDAPKSKLEYRQRLVRPQTDDEFLSENNLGTGVYGPREYWQQVENFGQLLYAQAAFEDYLFWLAERVTRRRVSREGFSYSYIGDDGDVREGELRPWDRLSDDEKRDQGTLPEYAEALLADASDDQADLIDTTDRLVDTRYDGLPTRAKLQAIRQVTSYDPGRRAPQGRIIMARHEMSRSKDGKLLEAATNPGRRTASTTRPQGPNSS